ncbi:hypothetical protein KUL42_17180 [Alteromonas sp. KUL42]|uniref:serine hydrolase domain-containing protein n=1 Tax=Alteromonas sp. KUL42 TaxID=2480797 RepID=UPI00103597AF|nr:serine hydrolase domain-containing protein [Alteromonas sp. KUL42]TAP36735.1 class A beta-lactamase-related serine hydrolase [Alteromonas sp. KUL42]GEA06957.1 hypothetical protein KUL42_17180 [Alteromonas sp. KUL42]
MKKLISIISLCVLLITFYLFYPQQKEPNKDLNSLDELIPVLMEDASIPGLAVAKIENGEVVYVDTFGFANIEEKKFVTKDTLFNIASISKPIMGVILLQLVDQKKLALDSDINEYSSFTIDNPFLQNEVITLRHLASHSSGIDDYYDPKSYSENKDSPVGLRSHLKDRLVNSGEYYNEGRYYLEYTPGSQRKYSNLGAALAGHLVEEVTGMNLAEYAKKHLFPLLGMPSAGWLLSDVNVANIAVPYEVEQCVPWFYLCANSEDTLVNYAINQFVNPPNQYKRFVPYPHFGNPQYPDGGVRASIQELSNFLKHVLSNSDLDGKPILSERMYNEMFHLQLDSSVSDSQRFFWRDRNNLIGHMGSDLGTFAAVYFNLDIKDGFIILMNRGMDSKSASAMRRIAKTLMQNHYSI